MVQTVPYQPTAEDQAVGTVPLSDAEAAAMSGGQMQPGVSLEDGPKGPVKPEEPAKPEIPEKFLRDGQLDTEALLKSYQELERKLGQPREAATEPDAQPQDDAQEADEASRSDPEEPAKEMDPSDNKFAEFSKKVADTGQLEEADYKKLQEEHGIPREMVDMYIEGYKAQMVQARQNLFQQAGIKGDEEYNSILEWGRDNLTAAEKDAFDRALMADNGAGAGWALAGLKARYVQANGQSPRLVRGDRSGGQSGGFKSREEFLSMIGSDAYQRGDPGVHAQFNAKLKAMDPKVRRAWLGGIDPQTTLGR